MLLALAGLGPEGRNLANLRPLPDPLPGLPYVPAAFGSSSKWEHIPVVGKDRIPPTAGGIMVHILFSFFVILPSGVLGLWIAIAPDSLPAFFPDERVPAFVRGIAGVAGLILTASSLAGLRHGLRLRWIIRSREPRPVQVSVKVHDDGDTTTYLARVLPEGSETVWLAPIHYNRAIDRLLDGSVHRVEAWSDKTGMPIALRVDSRIVETYPTVTRRNRNARA